jgi:hypothetical protein
MIQSRITSKPSPANNIRSDAIGGSRVYTTNNSLVNYISSVNNNPATEVIFNPTFALDFSHVINNLQSKCSVSSPALAQSRISGLIGGVWSGTSYIWDKTTL